VKRCQQERYLSFRSVGHFLEVISDPNSMTTSFRFSEQLMHTTLVSIIWLIVPSAKTLEHLSAVLAQRRSSGLQTDLASGNSHPLIGEI
jgi:hypothetical protein